MGLAPLVTIYKVDEAGPSMSISMSGRQEQILKEGTEPRVTRSLEGCGHMGAGKLFCGEKRWYLVCTLGPGGFQHMVSAQKEESY